MVQSAVGMVAHLEPSGRARLPDPETRQLVRIGQAAEETIVALRDIIWLVDPKHNDFPGLVARMRDVAGQIEDGVEGVARVLGEVVALGQIDHVEPLIEQKVDITPREELRHVGTAFRRCTSY